MSLYLTIFDGDKEVVGWCFGQYSDFGAFRDAIAANLKSSDYPILMEHSDCDGEWPVGDLPNLKKELQKIAGHFQGIPPSEPQIGFEHTAQFRTEAKSLYECYHNVDGENVFEALIALCDKGLETRCPILFQ